ncbi:isoprenylcysteine carboxylmethyltransferase family protein [Dyadobacter sp. NIV53]|uniref:methyltransferase family protein n=1 Tax=Dyadobacter sp. NIV53 TaxID=2861765 RepID=UPI001C87A4E7|nr:isoprenylcysteine carboxylmethyltransferase family protein [Dyadobacter sp. NIV53]
MNLIFPITYMIWLLSEVILNRMLRSKSTDKQNADKNTLTIIWITVVAAITLAVFISMNIFVPILTNPVIQYIGLGIMYLGIILRIATVISLGRMFTVDVTIREDHKLKQDGIYRFLRHPSYFASLLTFVGFGISLNNWISLILVTISVIIVFQMRIRIEEIALIEQFGNEYLDYKRTVKGLIPFVW